MTITEAKKHCSVFNPVINNGITKCEHALDGEKCGSPHEFRCILRIFKDRENFASKGISHFSVSKINTFSKCARKFFFDYIARCSSPVMEDWLWIGSRWSVIRAKIDAGLPYKPIEQPLLDDVSDVAFWKMIAVAESYEQLMSGPQTLLLRADESEVRVEFTLDGLPFVGYLDGCQGLRSKIIEWKYAKAMPDRLSISRQATSYFIGIPEAEEFVLQWARKTSHKIGARSFGENGRAFAERLINSGEYDPEKIFKKIIYKKSDFDIAGETDRMIAIAHAISLARQKNLFPPEYSSCMMCSYKKYCSSHPKIGCKEPGCQYPDICNKVVKFL